MRPTSSRATKDWGVELDGSSDNLFEGDFIGTDATGTIALGNGQGGMNITADYNPVHQVPSFGGSDVVTRAIDDLVPSINNTIGGTSATAGNLITDNCGPGVAVTVYSSVGRSDHRQSDLRQYRRKPSISATTG